MNWWEWLAVARVATGLFVICAIELASRSAGDRGPLSQERILHSIGFCAALVVGALFVVLYSLGICCQMLWQGRVPITSRVWWSARAAKFSKSDGRPRRETVLVQMIELRRRKDPRLRNVSRPSNWPKFQLWEAPEATVLSAVENFGWLKDAGLTDQSVNAKPEPLLREWDSYAKNPPACTEVWDGIGQQKGRPFRRLIGGVREPAGGP